MTVELTWPDGLPSPLLGNYSRDEVEGFSESELSAGPSFVVPITDDTPTFHGVSYTMKTGDARRFQQFLRVNKFKTKSPWFNGPLPSNDGSTKMQECRFISGGYPQLSGTTSGGVCTYNATIMTREIVTDDEGYETELDAYWGVGNGDIDLSISLLDEGLCYADD